MNWIFMSAAILCLFPMMAISAYSANGENRINSEVQKKLAAGEKPNNLINEKSPYLLQHAFNPVEWYPWGDEAFQKAREENKPIFLSIGYSTCHWCHVMAHESFEDPETAAILNEWFVSIKVDREERPDIDQLYMAATQAMTGSGGWPMSVFLLADGSPFYAGTYFPPTSSYQRPGFKDLLTALNKAWHEKKEDLLESASRMITALESSNKASSSSINPGAFEEGYRQIAKIYDDKEGGFGKAPKFPRPVVFDFLFNHYLVTGNEQSKEMALFTLQKMGAGGMYDQIGGGFHRYSVDDHWFVSHFEKMLYDQAQLASSYLDAYQLTKDKLYADFARNIFTYTLRDMADAAGGFYSAEDADSDDPYNPGHHGEGAFYLWTKDDIDKKLIPQAAKIFNYAYGIKKNGNVDNDPMQEFTGRNILYQAVDTAKIAEHFKMKPQEVDESLQESKELLLQARQLRKRPHLDDKVITSWNGMMIAALAKGSRILQDPLLLSAAIRTASFIETTLYSQENHTLYRRYRLGESGLAGQLDDYAFLINGLLELYQASHDPKWLSWASDLTTQQIQLFWNEEGGFFYDSVEDPSIKLRMRDSYDGAEPAGNSVVAGNLLRLGQLLSREEYLRMANRLIDSFSDVINRYPPALPLLLNAWQQSNKKPTQVVIAGKPGAKDTEALLTVVNQNFTPGRLLLLADGGENQKFLALHLPFMETVGTIDGKAAAYVCSDFTCKMPVTDPSELQNQLDELATTD